MNNYRQILVSKIKFYEKMARKTRRSALKNWNSGAANRGVYEASLKVADQYDRDVIALATALKGYDEEHKL